MGRDLGRTVLTRGLALPLAAVPGGVLALGLVCAPATADDVTPGAGPTSASTPSVSPPSQQQIEDARNALDRLRDSRSASRSSNASHPSDPTTLTRVAGPVADTGGATSRISDEAWWTIGAGALVLLVASEATRNSVRRARHRKGA